MGSSPPSCLLPGRHGAPSPTTARKRASPPIRSPPFSHNRLFFDHAALFFLNAQGAYGLLPFALVFLLLFFFRWFAKMSRWVESKEGQAVLARLRDNDPDPLRLELGRKDVGNAGATAIAEGL